MIKVTYRSGQDIIGGCPTSVNRPMAINAKWVLNFANIRFSFLGSFNIARQNRKMFSCNIVIDCSRYWNFWLCPMSIESAAFKEHYAKCWH